MKKILLMFSLLTTTLLATACGQQPTTNTNQTATSTNPLTEVSKHKTANDCWVIINGQTYNVTSYIASHPGGDTILAGCGQDATTMFNNIGKHAGQAQNILSQYLVK